MKNTLLIYLLFVPFFLDAQTTGVRFETKPWKDIIQEAKAAHKLIFVDVYTDWCGPCKRMDKEVFPLPEVAKVYNASFINVKLDAEKGEGPAIAKRYAVRSYPTYLFINEEGILIYRSNGSMEPSAFIQVGKNALTEAKHPETIVQLEEKYLRDTTDNVVTYNYLRRLTNLRLPVGNILDNYIARLSPQERSEPRHIQLIVDNMIWLNRQLGFGPAFNALQANMTVFEQLREQGLTRKETFENIKDNVINTTLTTAIRTKDAGLFDKLKAMKADPDQDAFDNTYTISLSYYWGIKDYDRYKSTATGYLNDFLLRIPADTLERRDAVVYNTAKEEIEKKNDPRYNNPEHLSTYKHAYTIQLTAALSSVAEKFFKLPLAPAEMQQARLWALKAMQIAETDTAYYKNVYPFYRKIYAVGLYASGEQAEGIKLMKEVVVGLPQTPKVKELFGDVLEQMEAGRKTEF